MEQDYRIQKNEGKIDSLYESVNSIEKKVLTIGIVQDDLCKITQGMEEDLKEMLSILNWLRVSKRFVLGIGFIVLTAYSVFSENLHAFLQNHIKL